MTGGVPDSGGGLGKAASSDGDGGGVVGAGRRIHPLWTPAMIHPVEEGRKGSASAGSMGLHKRWVYNLPSSGSPPPSPTRPVCTEGLELTQTKPRAQSHNFLTEIQGGHYFCSEDILGLFSKF